MLYGLTSRDNVKHIPYSVYCNSHYKANIKTSTMLCAWMSTERENSRIFAKQEGSPVAKIRGLVSAVTFLLLPFLCMGDKEK